MVGNKTLVLVIAVLAVGLFVLPSALSLFANQHTFVAGTSVNCDKCHTTERHELSVGEVHKGYQCSACHGVIPGDPSHTDVVTIECLGCHETSAPGPKFSVATDFNVAGEVHKAFYDAAVTDDLLVGADEACIACHTMADVNITWKKATAMAFTAGHDAAGWAVDNFAAE